MSVRSRGGPSARPARACTAQSSADPGEDAGEQPDQGDGQEHQVIPQLAGLDRPAPVAGHVDHWPSRLTRPSTATLSKTPFQLAQPLGHEAAAVDHAVDQELVDLAAEAGEGQARPDEDGASRVVEVPLVVTRKL